MTEVATTEYIKSNVDENEALNYTIALRFVVASVMRYEQPEACAKFNTPMTCGSIDFTPFVDPRSSTIMVVITRGTTPFTYKGPGAWKEHDLDYSPPRTLKEAKKQNQSIRRTLSLPQEAAVFVLPYAGPAKDTNGLIKRWIDEDAHSLLWQAQVNADSIYHGLGIRAVNRRASPRLPKEGTMTRRVLDAIRNAPKSRPANLDFVTHPSKYVSRLRELGWSIDPAGAAAKAAGGKTDAKGYVMARNPRPHGGPHVTES